MNVSWAENLMDGVGELHLLYVDELGIMAKYTERYGGNPDVAGEAFEVVDTVEAAAEEAACRPLALEESFVPLPLAAWENLHGHTVVVVLLAQKIEQLVAARHHGEVVAVAGPRHINVPQVVLRHIDEAEAVCFLVWTEDSSDKVGYWFDFVQQFFHHV